MHFVEPHYHWRPYYIASEDVLSPFHGRQYNEFEFTNKVYNFLLHPQWDFFGSQTLFLKILYVDYSDQVAVIEMIGEWNDAIENDIMHLKNEIIGPLIDLDINKFILIGENVLNFHYSDECYYEEWFDEINDGWIAMVNFHEHVIKELQSISLDQYLISGGELDEMEWRSHTPMQFFNKISSIVDRRLNEIPLYLD
tara:strand:- start:915 stop:1502 length:588 start_codon:yes stop_codon:yes gene_type:complete